MAIEVTESGSMMITGEHVEVYRLLAIQSMLALEINTGMKMSRGGSPMAVANSITGSTKRNKKAALVALVDHTEALTGIECTNPTVLRAIGR